MNQFQWTYISNGFEKCVFKWRERKQRQKICIIIIYNHIKWQHIQQVQNKRTKKRGTVKAPHRVRHTDNMEWGRAWKGEEKKWQQFNFNRWTTATAFYASATLCVHAFFLLMEIHYGRVFFFHCFSLRSVLLVQMVERCQFFFWLIHFRMTKQYDFIHAHPKKSLALVIGIRQ